MSTNILPNEDELFFQLALSFVPGIGGKTARALLNHYETATNIFKASIKDLQRIEGVGEFRAGKFRDKEAFTFAAQERAYIEKHEVQPLFFNKPGYPKRFFNCDDAPILLYYKGAADLNSERIVAIIGTRKNTDYGQRATEELITQLQGMEGLVIVSGLALGIDSIAHKAAIKNNIATVGVLGHGLDRLYPTSNKQLAKEMMAQGGLLTEFPSGTNPDRQNFPIRNRVVAGMSDVTILVESDIKGGAMITAYMALSYGRDVAAFPGRLYDGKSSGSNLLIKKNIAALITNADDLMELMNWQQKEEKKVVQKQMFITLNEEEQKLMALLHEKDGLHADELLMQSGFTYPQLASILLQLEMQGLVKSLPGKMYREN